MNSLTLLIVEDDKDALDQYVREIKAYNLDSEVKINHVSKDNKEDAIEFLRDPENLIDAAIIDLKLSVNGVDDRYSGNEVIHEVRENLRFPVFVVTSTPHEIDPNYRDQNDLFQIVTRGQNDNLFEDIVKLHNTGITKILGRSGQIELYLKEIFWKHLSNSVKIWAQDSTRTSKQKEKSLLRYTLSHIQEHLEISEESDFENYHPAEIYIIPPVKPNVFTGDIVLEKSNSEMSIVLTPSCDLAQTKAKDILIVKIELENEGLLYEKINLIKKGKVSSELIKESETILHQLIENNFSNKYHFLPKYNSIPSGLINFQKIKSVRIKEFNTNFERIASINSNFTKDIVARFSYYYSRQGSPDFNINEIYNSLF